MPITLPATPGFTSIEWIDVGNVGFAQSPYTGEQQVYRWPFQAFAARVILPQMKSQAVIGPWVAAFLKMNGPEETFYLGDSVRKTQVGNKAGALKVGASATANSNLLPITGATGSFAPGDWIEVTFSGTPRLHRVIADNGTNLEVFPRLRGAYVSGTDIVFASPRGVFRLAERVGWSYDERKIAGGVTFSAMEAL